MQFQASPFGAYIPLVLISRLDAHSFHLRFGRLLCLHLLFGQYFALITEFIDVLKGRPCLVETLERRQEELIIFEHADCIVCLAGDFD